MKITAITPTGDRPIPFALCEKWMAQQTRAVDEWIVVDDRKVPTRCTMGQIRVSRHPVAGDPPHTLAVNLKAAISMVTGDVVLIIEDDDHYKPHYVAKMAELLGRHDLAGQVHTRFYRLKRRQWKQFENMDHVSLFRTGMRRCVLPTLHDVCNNNHWTVDRRLWSAWKSRRAMVRGDVDPWSIGIKELPGRPGQTWDWRDTDKGYHVDTDGVFAQWLASDAHHYTQYLGHAQ